MATTTANTGFAEGNGLKMYYAHITLVHRAEWLLSMIGEFLDAPMPEAE